MVRAREVPGGVDRAERERRVAVCAAIEERRGAPLAIAEQDHGQIEDRARDRPARELVAARDRVPAVPHERDGETAGGEGGIGRGIGGRHRRERTARADSGPCVRMRAALLAAGRRMARAARRTRFVAALHREG